MSVNHTFLDLIVKYLNNPFDTGLKEEVDRFRSLSPENEVYFNEIRQTWLLSAKAKSLDPAREKAAVKRLKEAINDDVKVKIINWTWVRNIAATLLITAAAYWIYRISTAQVWLTKTTASNIDSVRLSDGSVIVLATGSEIRYPEKFGTNPVRNIFFSRGQAFFRIAKDHKHPFKISMGRSDVTVLGTSFNIHRSDSLIDLSVKTGKVRFMPYTGGNASVLIAGQALSYDIVHASYTTKNAQNADAWLTHRLVFEDTPLNIVCQQLTDYYKTPIKLDSPSGAIKELNATFTNNTLDEVLEILSQTYNIKVNKQPHQIILTSY